MDNWLITSVHVAFLASILFTLLGCIILYANKANLRELGTLCSLYSEDLKDFEKTDALIKKVNNRLTAAWLLSGCSAALLTYSVLAFIYCIISSWR